MLKTDFFQQPDLTLGTTAGTACAGNDARLSEPRPPSTHASTHAAGQSDAVSISSTQVSGLGGAALLNVGSTTGTVCAGNDSRLTNSRTCNNSFDSASTARTNLSVYSKLESDYSISSKPSIGGCNFTAAATGSNIVISDSANLNPGTNNFSIGPIRIYTVHDGYYDLVNKLSGNDGWKLSYTTNTGILSLVIGTGSTTLTATCPTALSTWSSSTTQLSEIIVTVSRGVSTASVQFYCNGSAVGAAQTIALTNSTSVSSSEPITIFNRMACAVFSPLSPLWNYSLSAAIVRNIFNIGLIGYLSSEFRFKWGAMANTTTTENSTFVGGTVGNWAVFDSTRAVVSNELEWTLPASSSVVSYLQCNQIPSQFATGYGNVRFDYKLSSGSALPLTITRAGIDSIGTITPTSDWQTFTGQFSASGGGAIKIATASGAANGSVYLFDNFETTKAGCVCAYDDNPNGYQWHDIGTNLLHATLGVEASPMSVEKTGRLRYSSATSGTEFIFGSDRVCLPANHVIDKIYAYVTSGTPTIDIGTAASAADIAASQILASGWNDIALSNLQSSTFKLNVTSNTSNSIVWNVNYSILLA